jgi:HPt (histidine-containing phosphotransfer) domain-containing protein
MKPLYDLKKLKELCNQDPELIEESIKFFYDETVYNLSLMIVKLEKHEFNDVRSIAHRMKVNFVFIGSGLCVDLCKKIKHQATNEEIEVLVTQLKSEYFKIYQQLKIQYFKILNYEDISFFKKIE